MLTSSNEIKRESFAESQKSKVVVRAKVPWEQNLPCLIAVVLDVESILGAAKSSVEDEWVVVEIVKAEAGK